MPRRNSSTDVLKTIDKYNRTENTLSNIISVPNFESPTYEQATKATVEMPANGQPKQQHILTETTELILPTTTAKNLDNLTDQCHSKKTDNLIDPCHMTDAWTDIRRQTVQLKDPTLSMKEMINKHQELI